MKLSDYIVQVLEKFEIDIVFGYTGGSIADIVDSIYKSKYTKYIQSYNEQASAFSANAYAQVTGKTGVAISSSGPGAMNLINGIANAYYDSIPCVFITGNVHSLARKSSVGIRQNAFQETDIVEIVKPITKYSVYVERAEDIKDIVEKAFYVAQDGRKGPVLIDIPYDIQRLDINVDNLREYCDIQKQKEHIEIEEIKEIILNASRPLLLVGGGCQQAKQILRKVLKKISLPVVASMRGLDIISHQSDNYIGFIGAYGNHLANLAILHCDLLIVLGSRLDERQMGYDKNAFAPNAQIIQVDIDNNELGRKTDNKVSLCSSVESFLETFYEEMPVYSCDRWIQLLNKWKTNVYTEIYKGKEVCANNLVDKLSEVFDDDAIILSDVGQNQIICAQSLNLREENIFLCSSGLGCMGYSIPAAIGACYASTKRQIISINGDGGIMMNIQELQTIKRENLPVKIIILNNRCLGLIRKLQEKLFNERYYASIDGYSTPNFKGIALAFEFDYMEIDNLTDIQGCCPLLRNEKPAIIEIQLPNVMATISEPGENIYTQLPHLSNEVLNKFKEQVEMM